MQTLISEPQSSVQSFLSPAEIRASGDSSIWHHHPTPSVIVPELVEPDPLERTLGCSMLRFAEQYNLGSDMEPILMHTHEFSLENDDGQEYPVTFHLAADEKAVDPDPTHALVDAIALVSFTKPTSIFRSPVEPCIGLLGCDAV